MSLSEEQARARRIIQQAHLGEKPENWRDYALRAKAALASHALELIERAEALIEFADRLDPHNDLAQYKADALALDVSEYGDHLDVKEYAKIVQDWPGIATQGGHGYWPPVTPRQEGFQAGFNREPRKNPYTSGYPDVEWCHGYTAGLIARDEFEADLRGETCSCDLAEQSSAAPSHSLRAALVGRPGPFPDRYDRRNSSHINPWLACCPSRRPQPEEE